MRNVPEELKLCTMSSRVHVHVGRGPRAGQRTALSSLQACVVHDPMHERGQHARSSKGVTDERHSRQIAMQHAVRCGMRLVISLAHFQKLSIACAPLGVGQLDPSAGGQLAHSRLQPKGEEHERVLAGSASAKKFLA